jgi:putative DNA primase/helicase
VTLLAHRNSAGFGIYVGANPRTHNGGKGDEHVACARNLFADIDHNPSVDDARRIIRDAEMPAPTLVMLSGHGIQCYWRLATTLADLSLWTRLQRAVIVALASDRLIHNPERVMRLPGFTNTKPPPAPALLIEANPDRVYALDDLPAPIPLPQPRQSPPPREVPDTDMAKRMERCRKYLKKCPESISGQHGHSACLRAACECHRFALDEAAAWDVMRWWSAEKSGGEQWSDKEIAHKLRDAAAKVQAAGDYGVRLVSDRPPPWANGPARTAPTDVDAAIPAGSDASRNERQPPDPKTGDPNPLTLDPADPMPSARLFFERSYKSDEGRLLHHHQDEFTAWDGTRYVAVECGQMRSEVYEFLERAQRIKVRGENESLVAFQPNRAKVDNVIDALRAVVHLSATVRPPAWLGGAEQRPPAVEILAAANGLVHLPTGKVYPHTPAFFSNHALPFAYDPAAPSPMQWRKFLGTLWPDDPESIETLQEWMGYTLTGDTSQQKMLLLIGPPRSGKGTIGRVHTRLLGEWSVAGPTLASLETNFGLWPLIGRPLAIISDARLSARSDQAKVVERLLSISGEDSLTIDIKHRDPWTGRLPTRIMILTNELPKLADSSSAMANRFIVLRLNQSFLGHEDTGLEQRLTTPAELSGILNWAIEGWKRLRARGRFVQPESAAATVQDLQDLSSPVRMFLADCCELGPTFEVPGPHLWGAWLRWCDSQGRDHPGTMPTFGRDLKAGAPTVGTSKRRSGDDRVLYYTGIRVV